LGTPETGARKRSPGDFRDRQRPQNRHLTRESARKYGAIRQNPGNLSSHTTVWWAREDSNLQPSGYEPLALTIELRAPAAFLAHDPAKVQTFRTRPWAKSAGPKCYAQRALMAVQTMFRPDGHPRAAGGAPPQNSSTGDSRNLSTLLCVADSGRDASKVEAGPSPATARPCCPTTRS
jgi:hypothetical protein